MEYIVNECRIDDNSEATEFLRVGEILSHAHGRKLDGNPDVALMPVQRELLEIGALSGYFRRDYGRGLSISEGMPLNACRLALYVSPNFGTIHWRARVESDQETGSYDGSLRLVTDSGQGLASATVGSTSDTVYQFARLIEDNRSGDGWIIGGSARVRAMSEGVYGFALYGSGRGFRVVWAAISQTD